MEWDLTVLDAKRYGVFSCREDASLRDAAQRMMDEDVSALVVVDGDGFLAGIITHTDVVRGAREREAWEHEPVQNFMSPNVICVTASATLAEVAELLLDHCIHRVVVVRQEAGRQRPIGVVASSDVVYHLTRG